MRKSISLMVSAVMFLSTMTLLPVSGSDEYPYSVENYVDLDLDDARWPGFSPDGNLIVFNSKAEKADKMESIWVANSDGSDRRMVYRNSSKTIHSQVRNSAQMGKM